MVRKGVSTANLRRFFFAAIVVADTIVLDNDRQLRDVTMSRCPDMLSWVLTAVIAVQPAVVFPCTCKAPSGTLSKAPEKQSCCHKMAGVHKPVGSPPGIAEYSPPEKRQCCCGGANASACACKTRAPASPQATPPQRIQSDDFAAFPLSIHGSLPHIVPSIHPTWAVDFLPAYVSASERCIFLCRLLF